MKYWISCIPFLVLHWITLQSYIHVTCKEAEYYGLQGSIPLPSPASTFTPLLLLLLLHLLLLKFYHKEVNWLQQPPNYMFSVFRRKFLKNPNFCYYIAIVPGSSNNIIKTNFIHPTIISSELFLWYSSFDIIQIKA